MKRLLVDWLFRGADNVSMSNWKPICDDYEVSDSGKVRSLKFSKVKTLKPYLVGDGYPAVTLRREGKRRIHYIHRLVAEAFIGPCPPDHEVCHGPNGRLDSSANNLSYKTHRDNCSDDVNRDHIYSSRYPGVSRYAPSSKWVAQIQIDGKLIYLGRFNQEEDAALAYRRARQRAEGSRGSDVSAVSISK